MNSQNFLPNDAETTAIVDAFRRLQEDPALQTEARTNPGRARPARPERHRPTRGRGRADGRPGRRRRGPAQRLVVQRLNLPHTWFPPTSARLEAAA